MADDSRGPAGRGDRVLDTLGLATRAGRVAVGTRQVLEAARAGELRLALLAEDATANAVGRVAGALEGVPVMRRGDKAALGRAVGRGPTAVVGVRDRGLAAKMSRLAEARREGADDRDRDAAAEGTPAAERSTQRT